MSNLSGPRERRRIDAWWARLAAHRDRLAQQEQAAAQIRQLLLWLRRDDPPDPQ